MGQDNIICFEVGWMMCAHVYERVNTLDDYKVKN